MREVTTSLYCGDYNDWLSLAKIGFADGDVDQPTDGWAVLHACKEPCHRQFVGYTGRGCPKDSPEYFWAERGNRLALNIIDAHKPEFFNKGMIDKGLDFIDEKLNEGLKVLVHCNEGLSRSPSIALLYLIKNYIIKSDTLEDCEAEFLKVYPEYNPGAGMRGFVKEHFKEYHYKYWDIVEGGPCPYCGNCDLEYDIVTEDDDSQHDVVDCPTCGNRLYYECY